MRSGEETRAALVTFVARWQTYAGTERSDQDGAEIARRLLALNQEIASGKRPYNPFATQDGKAAAHQLGLLDG